MRRQAHRLDRRDEHDAQRHQRLDRRQPLTRLQPLCRLLRVRHAPYAHERGAVEVDFRLGLPWQSGHRAHHLHHRWLLPTV